MRLTGAARAAFPRLHCGLNSVAFVFGCGGIGRFEIVAERRGGARTMHL